MDIFQIYPSKNIRPDNNHRQSVVPYIRIHRTHIILASRILTTNSELQTKYWKPHASLEPTLLNFKNSLLKTFWAASGRISQIKDEKIHFRSYNVYSTHLRLSVVHICVWHIKTYILSFFRPFVCLCLYVSICVYLCLGKRGKTLLVLLLLLSTGPKLDRGESNYLNQSDFVSKMFYS